MKEKSLMTKKILPVLNQGQSEASEAILRFLFSGDKEFSISGPAGTGKTTLMQNVAFEVLDLYAKSCHLMGAKPIDFEVILTATTNKAAEVLAEATGLPTQTIHSHMNLKVFDDYTTGKSKITPTNSWTVHHNQLIFIDEASMIDETLYEYLMKGTDSSCKIIYLGDHCQMAPVFENISTVYRNPKNAAFLTQPMRNANQPALVNLCNQLRHTVETGEFHPIDPVPGVIDYLDEDQAYRYLHNTFQKENPPSRILAYSNARVQKYLEYIRNIRGYPQTFIEGENLVNNTPIQIGKTFLHAEEELVVTHVSPNITWAEIDENDQNGKFEVQTITVTHANTNGPNISVRVPIYPDHFKSLSNYYRRQKNWNLFYKMKNNFPDLRQRDSSTVYKAQGSTYEEVFLDLDNIGKCNQNDQLARMLYVGVSRAKSRLLLFGDLPARLFNRAA